MAGSPLTTHQKPKQTKTRPRYSICVCLVLPKGKGWKCRSAAEKPSPALFGRLFLTTKCTFINTCTQTYTNSVLIGFRNAFLSINKFREELNCSEVKAQLQSEANGVLFAFSPFLPSCHIHRTDFSSCIAQDAGRQLGPRGTKKFLGQGFSPPLHSGAGEKVGRGGSRGADKLLSLIFPFFSNIPLGLIWIFCQYCGTNPAFSLPSTPKGRDTIKIETLAQMSAKFEKLKSIIAITIVIDAPSPTKKTPKPKQKTWKVILWMN